MTQAGRTPIKPPPEWQLSTHSCRWRANDRFHWQALAEACFRSLAAAFVKGREPSRRAGLPLDGAVKAARELSGQASNLNTPDERGRMRKWYRQRYLDLLGSIYIYNEHRGYTAIDRVLEAIRARWPNDRALISKVEKHRADERKHYLMFRRWFERRGTMPLRVNRTCGHIDRFVAIMFRSAIDDLDPLAVVGRDDLFERMCRVISLTEQRGHRQVRILLRHTIVQSDPQLMKIFRIIEQDEPSHWAPYEEWLLTHGRRESSWWERAIDHAIHSELLFVKLPILFLTPRTNRLSRWPEEEDLEALAAQDVEALAA